MRKVLCGVGAVVAIVTGFAAIYGIGLVQPWLRLSRHDGPIDVFMTGMTVIGGAAGIGLALVMLGVVWHALYRRCCAYWESRDTGEGND